MDCKELRHQINPNLSGDLEIVVWIETEDEWISYKIHDISDVRENGEKKVAIICKEKNDD